MIQRTGSPAPPLPRPASGSDPRDPGWRRKTRMKKRPAHFCSSRPFPYEFSSRMIAFPDKMQNLFLFLPAEGGEE
ncbi:MAG TPA: hypothetical protein DD433_03460 [Ruminococcaceae bacterium]|nr:hypothetical protein [Oscillospiraceae bacterium]